MASDPQPVEALEGKPHKEAMEITESTAEDSHGSDNDGSRPVRQKLKQTSITSIPLEQATNDNKETTGKEETGAINGPEKLQDGSESRSSSRGRKRSFDEDEDENDDEEYGHRRKRSRDSTTEGDEQQPQAEVSNSRKILSPKKKRSRDQLDKEEPKEAALQETVDKAESGVSAKEGQPEKKRHRDSSTERKPATITSAFANTSSVSPFGSLGATKAEEKPAKAASVTSNSAFASSSLAAFASSEQSPFGSLGASTPSVFKSPTPAESEKPASIGFASAAGTSGFASLGSGFSGFSGGFGAAAKSGGLTSFASPAAPSILGSSTKDKAFGTAEDEEEEEEEGEGETGPKEFEQEKTDERFFEQQIETGEEEEKTYFSCKAKLFQFTNKEWKERGLGTFKVNVKVNDGKEDKKAARMLMRADGVLRVMLNSPIFKGMKVGDGAGNEPKSKQIHLAGVEDGRTVPLLLRMGNEELAKELYHVIQDLLKHQ